VKIEYDSENLRVEKKSKKNKQLDGGKCQEQKANQKPPWIIG
jgi:hypothetical protein